MQRAAHSFARPTLGSVIFFLLLAILASNSVAQCSHAGNGIGSIPYPSGGPYQGVSFRVWAPDANSVNVEGDFNGWSQTATPLVKQGMTGFWCLDVPGATINQQYDYVISSLIYGTVIRRDPNSRLVTSATLGTGNSIIYDPTAYPWQTQNFLRPPLNKLVIYEMHIGTFNATPSSPGTFQSAMSKLNQISGLGFNAVELLPVTQFDGIYGNPYGPTDQYATDNDEYGGPDNFKAFVDACHQQGLAVIVDVVHNHWGPFDLATYQFDGLQTATYPGGIYFYDDVITTGDRYDSPWGSRPNSSNPVVQNYMSGQIAMWFNEYHADGLRWDSVSNIYNTWNGGFGKNPNTGKPGVFLTDGISLLRNVNTTWPTTYRIAEDLSFSAAQHLVTQPIASGGLGFESQWNATLGYYIRKDFPSSKISQSDVIAGMTSTFNNNFLQAVAYFESHNELVTANSRLIQLVDLQDPTSRTARKKQALAAAILFTSPEVPMLYQGDEFLDTSWLDFKTPLNWTNAQTWAGIGALYGSLVNLRTNAAGTTPGLSDPNLNVYQKDATNNVIVYDRYNQTAPGTDDVIVVANLSATVFNGASQYTIGLPYGGAWQVAFNSDSTTYSTDFGNIGPAGPVTAVNAPFAGQPYSATIPIGDYSVLILTQR